VATLRSWGIAPSSFGGSNVQFDFVNLQVIRSDSPYPYAEAIVEIKYSDQVNSGWGRLGKSIANALSTDINYLDVDQLIGQILHWVRHDDVQFGKDKEGAPIVGSVFEMVAIVQPGQTVTPVGQQAPPVAEAVAYAPNTVVAPPPAPPATSVAAQPVIVATPPTAEAVVANAAGTTVAAASAVDPKIHALTLLHTRNKAQFFQVALPDPIIRSDQALVDAILSDSFIQSRLAEGSITQMPDETYSVAGM